MERFLRAPWPVKTRSVHGLYGASIMKGHGSRGTAKGGNNACDQKISKHYLHLFSSIDMGFGGCLALFERSSEASGGALSEFSRPQNLFGSFGIRQKNVGDRQYCDRHRGTTRMVPFGAACAGMDKLRNELSKERSNFTFKTKYLRKEVFLSLQKKSDSTPSPPSPDSSPLASQGYQIRK